MEEVKESNISTPAVSEVLRTILNGGQASAEQLYGLADAADDEKICADIITAAQIVTARMCPRKFDSCSIINARSGLCSENCKWCAQSHCHSTGCETYDLVDRELAHKMARHNAAKGVGRFSLVASGRAVKGKALNDMAGLIKDIAENDGISVCASLGLLNAEDFKVLTAAGVHRYHCNMETAPSYFPALCSSHTQADKMNTIRTAREAGMEICSGGIIGMGESRRQRVELALYLREVDPVSIPINILAPIAGTPLEGTPLISESEILLTVALFRLAHPRIQLRLAGGRARISRPTLLLLMRTGINGAIIGDLLTTTGSTIDSDRALAEEAGYTF